MYNGQTAATNELNPLRLKSRRPCKLKEEAQAYNTPNKIQDIITWFCAPSKSETRPTQARPQELYYEVEGWKVKGKNLRLKLSSEITKLLYSLGLKLGRPGRIQGGNTGL